MPARAIVTGGTVADCSQAEKLIEGIEAGCSIADKGYDTDEVVGLALAAGMQVE